MLCLKKRSDKLKKHVAASLFVKNISSQMDLFSILLYVYFGFSGLSLYVKYFSSLFQLHEMYRSHRVWDLRLSAEVFQLQGGTHLAGESRPK